MPASGNETPTGDSTPSFDFLREHDDGSRTRWPTDPDHDSATDMLPPEDDPQKTDPISKPDSKSADSGSSIHNTLMTPAAANPTSDSQPETDVHSEPAAPPDSELPQESVEADAALEDADTPADTADQPDAEKAESLNLETTARPTAGSGGSSWNLLVVALASYASAVTLALLYLLIQRGATDPSLLESLPDVPPLKDGEVQLVPIEAVMPPGHTLGLGDSQRFGDIVIEPYQVVREPLAFVHFSGQEDVNRPDTEPVVKLWVRFTNVSTDQPIAPLDGETLFKRVFRPETGQTRANQFVCSLDTKDNDREPVFVFDYSPSDEFDLVDQELGRVLQPGESYETYIPTTEAALDRLNGELIWRIHFRKGYSPKGYGVTTVVEVKFDRERIDSRSTAT